MHGDHGNAQIHGLDVVLGDELGHGAAAALIGLAQLAGLPDHAVLGHDPSHPRHELGGGIVGAALTAVTRVLGHGHAAVEESGVAALVDLGKVGVEASRHVGGQALGIGLDGGEVTAQSGRDLGDQIGQQLALHARVALGADLLLVRQDDHGGVDGIIGAEQSGDGGVGADAVIVTVRADEGAIQTHVAGLAGGNGGQIRGEKILLGDAVLLVEQSQHVQTDGIAALKTGVGTGAHQQVQTLGGEGGAQRLGGLILGQMGEQIVDVDDGVGGILTDADVDHGAVLLHHHAVESQGNRHPLVLADTAVVVGLEEGHAAVLVERGLLDVDAGHVHVGGHDADTVVDGLATDTEQVQVAAAVVVVVFPADLQGHTQCVGNVALLFGHLDGHGHGLPLGLGGIQVGHVAGSIIVSGLDGGLVGLLVEVGLLIAQLGFQLTCGDLVRHDVYPRFFEFSVFWVV